MSDVSKTIPELIAEAQEHYSEMNGLNSRAAEVMMELVAALEAKTGVRVDMSSAVGVEAQLAAARVPVQGEPNDESDFRLARSRGYAALVAERDFTGHMDEGRRTAYYEGFKLGRKHPQGEPSDDREARKIAEKLFPLDGSEPGTVFEARRRAVEAIRLSRATVPDAASAAIERVRAICAEAKAARARNVATSKRLGYASSSTSERVPGMDDVLAALDGAPEPEAGTKVVIGKQNRGDDGESWTFTEWEPFELEKAREEFPNSVYEVVTVFGLPVEGEKP